MKRSRMYDLEMDAVAADWATGAAAVEALAAGCDALLVCHTEERQDAAVHALVREAERSAAFRARCEEASARVARARKRATARPLPDSAIAQILGGPESCAVAEELRARLRRAS